MGWFIFISLIACACFAEGINCFTDGNIGGGFGYMVFPILFGIVIAIGIVSAVKTEKKVKAKIKELELELAKWSDMSEKIKAQNFTSKDLFNELHAMLLQKNVRDIEETQKDNFKFLSFIAPNEKHGLFILQEIDELNFDALASLMKVIEDNKNENTDIFYINEYINNVYENLMVRCFQTMSGVFIYNKETFINDIKPVIADINSQIEIQKKILNPPPKVKKKIFRGGSYEKIFPHMTTTDSDPDYLQQMDDWEWMDDDF